MLDKLKQMSAKELAIETLRYTVLAITYGICFYFAWNVWQLLGESPSSYEDYEDGDPYECAPYNC